MKTHWRCLWMPLVWILLCGVSTQSRALQFTPALEVAEWQVQGNLFECKISQPIPDFGQAIFYHQAGETLQFYLMANTPRMKSGRAALTITSPVWKPGGRVEQLGYVDVAKEDETINLNEQQSNKLLHALYEGRQIEFSRRAWYDTQQSIRVGVSNINFRGAYDKYVLCLAELLPVNYGQIERTSLLFSSGQEELSESQTERLDDILVYSAADELIQSLYVDGHTDSQGTRAENMEISKRRAEMVRKYLVDGGIDPNAIVLRWHGERYPIASNRSADGRAKNRRVTVRVSKEPPPELPDFKMDGPEPELDVEKLLNSAAKASEPN